MPSPILTDIPDQILALPEEVKRSGESRLQSADDARNALNQLLQEDEPRSCQRAIVKGCYDGNAPYNEKRRRDQGMNWSCNLNFLGLEGTLDSARIPYYGLFSGVPTYALFKTNYQLGNPEVSLWMTRLADKFTCLLNRWRQFKWHIQASQWEMLFEGWGPIIFDNDADWRFRAIPARAVLVPQGSPSCLDSRVPYVAIKCDYRIHELYKHIRDEKSAEARGWNVEATQYAIKCGTRGQNGDTNNMRNQSWEEWQKRYKNKELTASYTEFDIINCAHFFVLEYDGKVSHFILTYQSLAGKKEQNDFLFKDINRYDSYDQAMNVAFQNTGDGFWHSVRGIGLKSFKHEEVKNRLLCRTVDNAFIGSGILLKTLDAKSDQKMQLRVTNMVSYLPPGTEMQQQRMAGDIEGVLSVSRYVENNLAQKIGAFNQRSMGREDGRGEQPTATQVQYAAAKEGSLSASQIDNYYLDLDAIYTEVYRRVLSSSDPEAKRFRRECREAGIPEEAMDFDRMEYVRANRLSGYGSPQMRKMAMQEMIPIVAMLPEDGKRNWLNDYIAASQGADKVESYNPPMDEPDIQSAMATIENNLLHEGELPEVISGMDHVLHLSIHLDDAEERLAPLQQAVEEGQELDEATLQEAYRYVSALGEHSETHLAQIENDPSRQPMAKIFEGKLNLLTAFHGKLRSAIRSVKAQAAQAAREEQQAIAMGALDQVRLQSEQQKMAIQAAEAQQGMQIKQAKAQQQTQIKQGQATQKAILTAEQLRLERIKTAAKISNDRLNARAKNGSKKK